MDAEPGPPALHVPVRSPRSGRPVGFAQLFPLALLGLSRDGADRSPGHTSWSGRSRRGPGVRARSPSRVGARDPLSLLSSCRCWRRGRFCPAWQTMVPDLVPASGADSITLTRPSFNRPRVGRCSRGLSSTARHHDGGRHQRVSYLAVLWALVVPGRCAPADLGEASRTGKGCIRSAGDAGVEGPLRGNCSASRACRSCSSCVLAGDLRVRGAQAPHGCGD